MTDKQEISVFHFDEKQDHFENYGEQNDIFFWYASQLMEFLGYRDFNTFHNAVNKAISACNALKIPIMDNFIQCRRTVKGKEITDYKLSRFACYLTAMNGDVRKPGVAAAQAYFATIAESFQKYVQEAENVERVSVREEVSDRENALHSTVKRAGIERYSFFQIAGYRGMYNMHISRLREMKKTPGNRTPLDFMGKDELAANLFRITQTDLKIRRDQVKGQFPLEETAEQVGRKVRDTMLEISGIAPENLPPAEDIRKVRSALKKTHKKFKKLDKGQK